SNKRRAGSVPLQIRLLGRLELLRSGSPVSLPSSRKTRALLAYLIAVPGRHSRDRLCELFWDGPDDPRAALRWSLTKLRQLVNDPHAIRIVANHEGALFDPLDAEIDVLTIRRDLSGGLPTVQVNALERAAERFRGE